VEVQIAGVGLCHNDIAVQPCAHAVPVSRCHNLLEIIRQHNAPDIMIGERCSDFIKTCR
jgi:hypothetical protein